MSLGKDLRTIVRVVAGVAIMGVALWNLAHHPADEHLRQWGYLAGFGGLLVAPEIVLAAIKALTPWATKKPDA